MVIKHCCHFGKHGSCFIDYLGPHWELMESSKSILEKYHSENQLLQKCELLSPVRNSFHVIVGNVRFTHGYIFWDTAIV